MTLTFPVHRREPVLVCPAAPTPRETKRLSDIDDHEVLRVHTPFFLIYRGCGDHAPVGPADVIRRALAEALVPYYPLAGRLREVEGRKLVVDCTGEGVMFVEADADVHLAELEAAGLRAPFPWMEQLLFDVQGSSGVLGYPLLLIQVTRLLCGGFAIALHVNHNMCDAMGVVQFMATVAELARGFPDPSVKPAWSRELLDARRRGASTRTVVHHEYVTVPLPPPAPRDDMAIRPFSFSPTDVAALRKHLPPNLRDTATTFEILTAFFWRARTVALALPPGEDTTLMIIVNFRGIDALGLPAGYYGNACVPSTAMTSTDTLRGAALGEVVELVRKAKAAVTAEHVRSLADHLVLRARPRIAMPNMFVVSDLRRAGFHRVDFGWGGPVYGGVLEVSSTGAFIVAVKNGHGEEEVVVPIMLPRPVMERFAWEIDRLLNA